MTRSLLDLLGEYADAEVLEAFIAREIDFLQLDEELDADDSLRAKALTLVGPLTMLGVPSVEDSEDEAS